MQDEKNGKNEMNVGAEGQSMANNEDNAPAIGTVEEVVVNLTFNEQGKEVLQSHERKVHFAPPAENVVKSIVSEEEWSKLGTVNESAKSYESNDASYDSKIKFWKEQQKQEVASETPEAPKYADRGQASSLKCDPEAKVERVEVLVDNSEENIRKLSDSVRKVVETNQKLRNELHDSCENVSECGSNEAVKDSKDSKMEMDGQSEGQNDKELSSVISDKEIKIEPSQVLEIEILEENEAVEYKGISSNTDAQAAGEVLGQIETRDGSLNDSADYESFSSSAKNEQPVYFNENAIHFDSEMGDALSENACTKASEEPVVLTAEVETETVLHMSNGEDFISIEKIETQEIATSHDEVKHEEAEKIMAEEENASVGWKQWFKNIFTCNC
ncbi:hypothetical protein ENBRE01_0985 [Enteropsectra breve]|nr:hypothetical protein ENBRE01_0985 [Enteropsectra breve]